MGPSPTGLLLLSTWLPDELHDAFSGWCDDHHRELLTVPGFMRARRFVFVEGSAPGDDAQFLTMYETADLAVLSSDAYVEHGRNSGGLPEFLRGRLRMSRLDCELESATPVDWWSGTAFSELLMITRPEGAPFSGSGPTSTAALPITARAYRASQGPRVLLVESVEDTAVDDVTESPDHWSRWRCVFEESAPAGAF
jgi:hypothetical protein